MKRVNSLLVTTSLLFSPLVGAQVTDSGTLAPTVVPMSNGGQASIALSNTDPNLFTVPGDRIVAMNSLDGALTNQEQTANGGVIVATVNKKPFTFIIETERGMNYSIRAVPRAGAGRTVQLVTELRGSGEPARVWEESMPYDAMLVSLSQGIRNGTLPDGYASIPVSGETLLPVAGVSSYPEAVWVGHHLKIVRFSVKNESLSPLNIRESDFWQQGTRAVMFSQPASMLMVNGRMSVWVILSGEGG
ncbi:TPA: type-F conjugative transfer system secretin TraK [Enterobacter roggenkampii]